MPYRKSSIPTDDERPDGLPALLVTPKVTAATLGGSIATVAIVVAEASGLTVTAELAAAVATLCAAVLGWAVKA